MQRNVLTHATRLDRLSSNSGESLCRRNNARIADSLNRLNRSPCPTGRQTDRPARVTGGGHSAISAGTAGAKRLWLDGRKTGGNRPAASNRSSLAHGTGRILTMSALVRPTSRPADAEHLDVCRKMKSGWRGIEHLAFVGFAEEQHQRLTTSDQSTRRLAARTRQATFGQSAISAITSGIISGAEKGMP